MSINDVLSQYDIDKRKNEAKLALRRQNAYAKMPELKALHDQIKDMQLEKLKQALFGEFDTTALKALLKDEKAMLISAGFDADFLNPIYTCPVCRDTGTLDDGTRCDCFKRRVLEDKLDAARLADGCISFENFNDKLFDDAPLDNNRSQRDIMSAIKIRCERYSNDFPDSKRILLLSGGIGLGKTYAARCIMRRVIEHGHTAAFYTAYRLFSLFHRHRLGEGVDLSAVFDVPLLVIDDIGTEPMTRNVTVEYFFDLINERLAMGRHTVIVTNLTLDNIKDRYGERIHSRLMDTQNSMKLKFEGSDIRY